MREDSQKTLGVVAQLDAIKILPEFHWELSVPLDFRLALGAAPVTLRSHPRDQIGPRL